MRLIAKDLLHTTEADELLRADILIDKGKTIKK